MVLKEMVLKEIGMNLSTPLKPLLVFAGLMLTAGAAAGDEYGVSFKASELKSSQGVSDVHARIVAEAKAYCPSYREAGSLRELKLCLEDVTNDLVNKINNPMLSRYHDREARVEIARLSSARDTDRS